MEPKYKRVLLKLSGEALAGAQKTGLEFDTVILWNPDMKHGLEQPETAKLLYVACTRALHELHILNN